MKKIGLLFVLFFTVFISYSQEKFVVGTSSGITGYFENNKEGADINYNLFAGYHISDRLIIGAEAFKSKLAVKDSKSIGLNSYLVYGEWLIKPYNEDGSLQKFHFSGLLSSGVSNMKFQGVTDNEFTLFVGTKACFNFHPKIQFGLKSGYFIVKDNNHFIANVFVSYKF